LKEDIKFKQDSCILHVVCKDISSASSLLNTAQQCGWKKSGILSLGKNIIVELCSSERIEFPLIYDGVLLVDKKFLQVVLKKSNFYLERCWKKIEKLEQFLSKPLK
jgi:tRNA wybutosine-synthesizing protein 3